jgi:predicted XRE-type DNA-binding protein
MVDRTIGGVEFELSSGNVFQDLGLDDADQLKTESSLAIEIARKIRIGGRCLDQNLPPSESNETA